ncbi:MAG: hypothetical protein IJ248_03310 [Candidatus Methanomethylophilaceae archaeon]|nr:hypothetical protein [Candidatus Methanomethylophilaceae archaeon]
MNSITSAKPPEASSEGALRQEILTTYDLDEIRKRAKKNGVRLSDILKKLPVIKRRTDESGCWPFVPDELIMQLVRGERSLSDPALQAILLDWIESEDYNKFINLESGEIIFAQSAKRGNVVYATRKTKKRDQMKDAIEGKIFDYPVKGFRNRRMTRLLLCTVNFDRSKFTCEEAWAALRSTPTEGVEYTFNVINSLNANISKIFGKHGTLTSKEAQSSGYPAPHLIFILDEPVMVERHKGKDGNVSWRLCEQRILNRIGKGPLMRKLARTDYRKAIDQNPIWKHGFIDFEGIVSEEGSRSGRDAITYPFKYLVKCLTEDGKNSIKDVPDINSIKDKDKRTMLFTHLGNKCFRIRDVSFGKGFKDRIGMLPEEKKEGHPEWKRVRTLTGYEYNFISAFNEQRSIQRFQEIFAEQNAGG